MASRDEQPWLDHGISRYATEHSTPPDELQRRLVAETAERLGERARMQVSPAQGSFLTMLTELTAARRAVEVGTFTGYSALSIARGLPDDGRLLACDISEEWTAIGRRYWAEAGVDHKIDLRIGPALETLGQLPMTAEIDLAFIDADKGNYHAYYEAILRRLRPGGLILVDNTIWSGAVLDDDDQSADTLAIRAFNDAVAADDRVTCVLLTVADGLTLLRKRD
jgi:caffeoyl-CoA O-methyltransferase